MEASTIVIITLVIGSIVTWLLVKYIRNHKHTWTRALIDKLSDDIL